MGMALSKKTEYCS